ncbi:hypothetical protein RHSIM_Rhsim07G0247600 [Rhododendron simsii]|uniref:Uncharacterized protein n=1 Tax=Rhododendron simsii TaxID=118357 RepID=A0A834GLE6_RHOSS|nr:hypothetical protein RHSIM_Rhsim07G0247600 [Rhododendron simsii]
MPSEDSKPVKKEVAENDEKPNNGKNNSKSNEEAKAKKEPVNDNDGGSEKPIAKKKPSSVNIPKVKKEESKKKPNNAKTPKSGSTKKTQAKKEEDYDSDDEKPISKKKPNDVDKRDPLRIFYETLYEQMPGSEMAAFWLMECGLLPEEVAKKVFEKKQKKNQLQKLGSPMKTVITVNKTSKSVTAKKETLSSPVSSQKKKKTPDSKVASKQTKKRKIEDGSCSEDGSDDDFVLSTKVAKRQKVA